MSYPIVPKPTREEIIKRMASNFLIAAIRQSGEMNVFAVDAALLLATKLHDAKIPLTDAS